ncbi:MAG TPA: 16S rRNA (cytosine(1402)-N(4))-methyltransferase RsmH [Steroidobacteraceae bacterium]|nr:16S rRNA (cytosine(1402)-N(4))-methyltransferase RsmH [Steroidobacteraceae bacterium]
MAEAAVPAHAPVLLDEAVAALAVRPGGTYVDATYGRGGHAEALLAGVGRGGRLVVVDRDPEAVADARRKLGNDPRVSIHQATFDRLLELVGPAAADGVLFDLGVSSPQLDDPARGFSFGRDGPLDMRMDPTTGPSAADFIASASEQEIAEVIAAFGEDRFARRIARAVVGARAARPLTTTGALAAAVAGAVPARMREPGKHPATRTFQALRIKVNRELELLEAGLAAALEILTVGGRLAVISFHSLEDRPVKRFMRRHAGGDPMWRGLPDAPLAARPRLALVGKARHPGQSEIARNPRARSAVLRVAEKVRA